MAPSGGCAGGSEPLFLASYQLRSTLEHQQETISSSLQSSTCTNTIEVHEMFVVRE